MRALSRVRGCSVRGKSQGFTFSEVPRAEIPRSTFSRSHGHKTVMNAGWLVPFYVDEVLPGDTFNCRVNVFARLSTPIVPLMDNLYLDTFFFFVPNRLVWSNWQKFCGEQDNPGDSTDFLVPQTTITLPSGAPTSAQADALLLYNYLGVPHYNVATPGAAITLNNLHARAYNLIWNEWFRDQNLQTRAVVDKDDGPDTWTDYVIRGRGKRHDYFTSCLPWPQKDAGVSIPVGGLVPVIPVGGSPTYQSAVSGNSHSLKAGSAGNVQDTAWQSDFAPAADSLMTWRDPQLQVDFSGQSGTINSLRTAFQIQKLLERDARGGTRYVELVKSHFGVTSPDARLQRPEYLGGGTTPIMIHQVPQTSGTAPQDGYTPTPQGNLAAYGVGISSRQGFVKSFVEHGVLLGLIAVRADLTYQQGMPRMFSRRTKHDFYWPALAHLGEQSVLNKEIFLQADGNAENDAVWGYQERWAEYRYYPNRISQQFQSAYPQTLDVWHLAEDFATLPTLGAAFMLSKPPIERVIAVPSEPHFILDTWFEIQAARPMPVYSVPGLVDHF